MSTYQRIPIETFDSELKSRYVGMYHAKEVSTSALGGKVLSCSDDFFVSRHNLIKPTPSISMKGQFGPNGALYDAWETRRHNPEYDWIIIKLAPALTTLDYVDIDTSHFSGNEAPMSQVFALQLDAPTDRLSHKDPRWIEVLPVVELGPNSRHIFKLATEGHWSAVMVRMIPDGGMARFRAYGLPIPPPSITSLSSVEPINLLDPCLGARIISCSDANFSPPGNLLLPTRGVDMSDGWETRRSQHNRGKYAPGQPLHGQERCEWVIARLACVGQVEHVEVDTAYHPGNYPVACTVEGILADEDLPTGQWTQIVTKQPLGPHRQHFFALESSSTSQLFSHVRLKTYPDGGLKRLRIYGHPTSTPLPVDTVPALPLTVEAFRPFGSVIQGFSLDTSAPKGTHVSVANQGTAFKFHRMAGVPEGSKVEVERQEPLYDVSQGSTVRVDKLHKSESIHIPMTSGGGRIVLVARDAAGQPDLATARAFLVTSAQGISFGPDVWHNDLTTVNTPAEYARISGDSITSAISPLSIRVPAFASHVSTPSPPSSSITDALKRTLQPGIHPVPMSAQAFAPFGSVIALDGSTTIQQSYESGAFTGISVFRATQKVGLTRGQPFDIRLMERHPHTSQVFIPMGKGEIPLKSEEALPSGGAFLVIVASNGPDDLPDPSTVRAFMMTGSMGLCYAPGVWHHPVLVLDASIDLACIETQLSTGVKEEADARDCELIEGAFGAVVVPN